MAEGGGLLNLYTGNSVSEVRILSAPPLTTIQPLSVLLRGREKAQDLRGSAGIAPHHAFQKIAIFCSLRCTILISSAPRRF